ncbi:unnamed protein product [Bemisia tabaci]|uniref:Dynein heavy chain n=1 Tax=Bemisia tabaci TaxID=7038 RepID=A0A9P0AMF6_BEMTA|nr:unnamed protein product [Bemisia tabaci]
MIFYYTNCEKKIFHTFIDVCLQNLRGFDDFLNGKESVIMIEALLGPQNVYLQPNFVQIYNLIILTVRRFMENFMKIPRWMHGTCLLCPEVFSEDKEFKHLFSFYDDLIGVKAINDVLLQIKLTAHRLVEDLSRYLSKWRKYQSVWLLDKDANVEKFAAQNPKFNAYEEKFSFYSDMLAELNAIETFTDIQCIRIDLTKLIDSLKTHLVLWKNKLGEKLANDTRKVMNNFQEKMLELKSSLETGVSEVVSFKIVLQAIADIKLLIVDAELIFEEVDERYHIMSLQNIAVSAEDRQLFSSLKSDWNSLLDLSMYRKLSLEPAKSVFAQITRNDIMKFGESTEVFTQRYYEEGPGSIKQNLKLGEGIIVEWRTLFASMNSERDEMLKVEKLFDLPKFSYDSYLAAFAHFQGMEVIYELYHRQKAAREQWGKSSWLNFNSQILYDGIEVFLAEFRHLPEAVQSLEAGSALLTTMLQFKESIPLFVKLKNEAIRSRHWKELMSRTGKHFDISTEAFNLLCVFEMELYDHKAACLEIINNALKELAIELSIKDIVTTWEAMQLQIVKYEGNKSDCDSSYMLGDVSGILLLLDDHTMMLQTMANSDFVGSFLQTIQKWEMNLSNVSEVLDEWVSCQSLWLHLAVGVFSNSILSEQLPKEREIFDQVDQTYRKIMIEAFKNPRVLDQCLDSSTRIPEFHDLFLKLELCRKALDQILDRKRMMFPRFFFLSDDELLAILGTLKPFHIKNFLIKVCEAIKLKSPQQAVGFLEEWMNSVTDEIRKTSWHLIKKAVYDYGKVKQPRAEWILNFQGMIIYAANSVWWTEEVENVFSNINKGEVNAMKDYLSIQNEQLEELAAFLDHLSPLDRRKISNMIVVDIHSRDVIETFVQNNVNSNEDFEWKKQLRFYWEKPMDNFIIKQCSTVISYGFEYSGLSERLVITPLSDRFYLTVTQALYFHLGASPVGFAGAGKSETVRDLAKTLGLLCIVIHCTSSMELGVFQLWLKGLCQCGAWGVFENLSQVNSSTLSALSIRIQSIFSASKNNLKKLNLDGQVLDFKDSVNLFVTVNPTSNSSFPEHLKSLFRPVACTMPDLEFISYVLLYSKGFISAKILSKKITVLFKLAAVKLSQQLQYDFSIRTLKLTIVTAAAKKEDVTDETVLIVQALKDVFWPKLVESDVQLFNELLKDIFAEVYYHLTVDKDLLAVIKMSLQENNYILVDKQIEKCAQLYYMLQIHHACMLVGPSGSGKSVIFQTLEKIQKNLRLSGKIHPVNPKSCSVDELFGCVDSRGVWRDGVLSSIFRTINAANYAKERKYILFDGEIDSTWVENLSSVIDQTKLLTLGNGERIQLLSHCALLFEVSHLHNTPPAIVSRFGLIYVCPSDLGYEAVWERWLNKFCHDENIKSLREFSQKYLKPILKFILAEKHDFEERRLPVQTVLPLSSLNMVTQFCFIMDVLLQNIKSKKHKIPDEILEALFIEGLYASFGVIITAAERNAFDSFVKNLTGFSLVDRDENNLVGLQSLPSEKSLYDCYVDVEKKCWSAWEDTISPSAPSGTFCPKFRDIFIPTADSSKLLSYLQRINEHYFKGKPQLELKNPTVLISEGSTYKTAIMNNFLRNLSCDEFAQLKISFSAQTNSSVVQSCLETMISKRTKSIYGPAEKKLVCFFDDLSAPKADEHGCQQVIAFLRSLYEKHGFYHQGENIQWRNVKDLGYYAAMCCGHNGSGVDPRFLSLVYVVNVTQLSDLIVTNIFSTILQNHTRDFGKDIQTIVPDVIKATSEMFQILRTEAPPIPHKFHYAFSLRDFSKVVAGLCLTTSRIFTTAQQFIRVWRNEFTRVTCDRLITKKDNSLIQNLFEGVIEKYFPSSLNYVIRDPLLFGDFRNAVIGDANPRRDYEDLLDYDAVFHLFEEVLLKYNEQNAPMRMILFNDALEHLTRLQRIFRLSDGHVLFLGPGGIGKQSLIRLAAFTAGCYEILNEIITSCVRPTFFNPTDKEIVVSQLKNDLPNSTDEDIWSRFLINCVENIHIAMTVSLETNALRRLCQNYPGLAKSMYLNWGFSWPAEAFSIIANTFLSHQDLLPDDYVEGVIEQLVYAHTTIDKYVMEYRAQFQRQVYVTCSSFFNCIHTLLDLLDERHSFLCTEQENLKNGIAKIKEVFEHAEELKAKLAIHSFMISEKAEEIQKTLEDINAAEKVGEEVKEEVSERQKEMEVISKELIDEKCEVEEMSSKIAPSLVAAKETLRHLDQEDISEICSYVAPPEVVQNIGECVAILLGTKEISWKRAKSIMSEPDFVSDLINLDCNIISQKQQQACRVHMKPAKKMETLKDISKAGYTLYLLMEEILAYCLVFKEIKTKNSKISRLEDELKVAQNYISQLNYKMKEANVALCLLHDSYEKSIAEKEKLQIEKGEIEIKMKAADELVDVLNPRHTRLGQPITQKICIGLEGDFPVSVAVANQLLSLTSKLVDSSLEEERTQLLHDGLTMEKAAKKFGDTFLLTLLKSSERILDHAQEIEPLLILNNEICETQEKLEAVKGTLKSVEEKRTVYAPLAEEISPIFFIFIEASLIENIYQYSLETFLNVFKSRLKSVFVNQPQDDVSTRCQAMLFELYKFGCSSVFKDHELFFSYQMAIKIDLIRSSISQSALNLVRRKLQSDSCEKESPVTWLTKEDWMRILKLSESFPQKLHTLPADIVENSAEWEKIQSSGDFISVFPSDHWVRKLAPFEELMVLLCISPGRICHSVERYVSTILGTEFLMPPTVDLADAFMNSTASTPILVIHSPDLDPSLTVAKLFKTFSSNVGLNFTTTRSELGESTLRLFDEMSVAGGWLAIQCWNKLDVVTNLGNQLCNRTPHPDFRLWIMINCASSFPLKLLRNCIKVCYEPTTDLKSNLVNTYSQLGSELSLSDHVAFSQVLYVLAFFHAVVQERGKYGRIGWNLPYEFSRTDFDLTVFTVATYCNEATEVGQNLPWSTIKYLINEILYGGRVVQESDKIILHTIVEEYFGDFLFDQFQSFHFFQDDLVDYDLPYGDCAEDFLRSIKNLPNQNHPGVFGLDENIEVKQVAEKARKMWATLRESEEEKMSPSTENSLISQVRDLSEKLVRPFDVVKIRSSYKMVVTPSATVLLQELNVFNLLLKVMSSTLTSLQKALDGETSLSEYLEQISVDILSNRIPDEWCKYSPMNSKSLSGWIQHFERRKLQFLDWSVRGDPVVIWLSGLFTPQAYIIALLQTACQKKSWSLDRSSFYTIVTNLMHESEVEERPEIGCFVQGIFIEGGRWDSSRECLAECRPGTLIEEMPILMIRPVEVSKLKLENTLRTPVYVTSERRSVENRGVVFEADLKLDKHHSFWILSGVCLMLNDDST